MLDSTSPIGASPVLTGRRPHAVVIGSGFGGLAAAVRLGARGWRVSVLERLEAIGGRARVFRQDGFTFDAGPTIITAPFLLEELWTLAGRRLADDIDLRALPLFYRIRFDDGSHFDYTGDADAMRAEVARLSPSDVDGYERFMQRCEAVCRIGFERLGHVPFDRMTDMLRIAPDLLRLECWRSVFGLVRRYVRDPRLRIVFSFHPLLIGGNPMRASAIYTLIPHLERQWGVHFAIGGTGAIVRGLASLIDGQGGVIRTGAEVDRIIVEGARARGVVLADGERIAADAVVSNADAAWTYAHLLRDAPGGTKRLTRARHSNGLFVWYFGTRRRFNDVPHHTIVLGPRYEGLLRDIFDRRVLAADMSLYLHRPTATDASLAPPGCDTFYVLSPVPHLSPDRASGLDRASGIDWAAQAEPYRQAIARRLDATMLPGFAADVVTSRVMHPGHFRSELLSVHGAGFGLEPVLTQSAWFRPHNRSRVAGLFLVGAGTHPGAGVPGVISTARVLDKVVPDVAVV